MEISTLIKSIREKRKLTGAEFARAIGVSRQLLHKWETGQNAPGDENLEMLGIEKFTDYRLKVKHRTR